MTRRTRRYAVGWVAALFGLAAVCCIPAFTGCGQGHRQGAPGDVFDFGSVFATETPAIRHTFRVQNTTGMAVALLSETHSCDCSRIEWEPTRLEPGASTNLTMTVDVAQVFARRNLTCTLKTDHPRFRDWTYTLQLVSYPLATIAPDRIDLGSFGARNPISYDQSLQSYPPQEVWLEFYGRDETSLPIPDEIESPPELEVQLDRTAKLEQVSGQVKRARYRITIALKRDFYSSGTFARPVSVSLTQGTPVTAIVVWEFKSPYVASPAFVDFGIIAPGDQPKFVPVVLKSIEDADRKVFAIASISTSDPTVAVKCKSLHAYDEAHKLDFVLNLEPAESRRAVSGFARVCIEGIGAPEIQIPWSAFVRAERNAPRQPDPCSISYKGGSP